MGSDIRRERFIRIAEARTNRIIEMFRLLGNCSSKSNYEYTDEDIKKIFGTLERELRMTKNKFTGIDSKDEKFSLQ